MEIWKAVIGFEGRYEVSNLGQIRALFVRRNRKEYPARPPVICGGPRRPESVGPYRQAGLRRADGAKEIRPVHKLVAEAFLGHRPPGMEVAHENGDGWDNRVENLMWATHAENMRQARGYGTMVPAIRVRRGRKPGKVKLSEEDVRAIREAARVGASATTLASVYSTSPHNVRNIVSGRRWAWLKEKNGNK